MDFPLNKRIKTFIKVNEFTYEAFGKKFGVSKATVEQWVNNKNTPNPSTLLKIIKAYPDLSADWLIRGEGIMLEKTSSRLNKLENLNLLNEPDQNFEYSHALIPALSIQHIKSLEDKIAVLERLIASKNSEIEASKQLIQILIDRLKE